VATGWSHIAAVNLIGSYNYVLVALSVLIAMFASYAALDLAGRVTAAGGWTRAVWLLGGAGAMGTGIWSMHYIGMLAFILPIPVAYHWPTVLLSLFAAILASVIALYVVSRQKMGASRAVAGSVLMGAGIASMHYIGMDAMRLPVMCQYNSFLVVLSVVFAVLISLAALWITFHFRDEKTGIGWEKLAGAVVMGAAIPVMHYTGMAAASFTPSGMPADLSHAVSISTLGTAGIAAVTFIVLGLALLTSWVDRRFAAQTLELQEEKLQRSEAYLAEAQTLSHTGSFGWRISTGEIAWSDETFRIFQYDRATKPTADLVRQRIHPEDAAIVKQTMERALEEGKDFDVEHRLLMPDGSIKHVHVVAHALSDESGNLEFIGAMTDVTVAKQAQQALRTSEQQWRDVFENNPTMYFMVDAGGTIMAVNPFGTEQLGYTVNELIGQPVLSVFCEFDREAVQRNVAQCLKQLGQSMSWELRNVRKDGSVLWVRETARAVLRGDDRVILIACEDITERKIAEEKIRQQELELRQFIDLAPQHVAVLGPDRDRLFSDSSLNINQAALDYHGLTFEEWQSSDPRKLFHPDDWDHIWKEDGSNFSIAVQNNSK
jgi:PAS domain S-box-containing protein